MRSIPFFCNVVNYGENGWSSIFSKQGKNVLSESTIRAANSMKTMDMAEYPLKWADWANKITDVDKSFVQFCADIDAGKRTVGDIKSYMEQASSSTAVLGETLKKVAANMAIMLAVSLAIKGIAALWDHLNVTVEESKKKYDELSSSLSTLQAEYDTFISRDYDSLSQSEKDRLEYLEDRIALEKELLEIQQHKIYREQLGGSFTDRFDKDSYTYKTSDTAQTTPFGSISLAISNLESLKDKAREYSDILTRTDSELIGDKLVDVEGKISLSESKLEDYLGSLKITMSDYQKEYNTLQEMIDSGVLTGSEIEQAKGYQGWYQDQINYFKGYINQISNLISTAPDTVTALDERLKNFSADDLKKDFSSDELDILLKATFDEDATIKELENIIDEAQSMAEKEPIEISFADSISNVSKIVSELDTLSAIFNDVKDKGNFDFSALTNDDFVKAFAGYTDEYNNFVKTISESPSDIKACQSAFDDLAAAWVNGSGVLDNLSEETKDATVNMLEQKGVANASEIVQTQLNVLNSLDNSDFVNTFKDAGEEYQNFIDVISNSPGDINACQTAYYDLIKTWADSTGILDDLTEANRDEKAALLESQGVANSTWVVNRILAQSYADQGFEAILAGASTDEYASKIQGLGLSAQETQAYIYQLQLAEIAANNQKLDFTEQIDACNKLAVAAGQATAMLSLAQSQRSVMQQLQAEGISWEEGLSSGRVSSIQDDLILNQVTNLQSKIASKIKSNVSTSFSGIPSSDSGGSKTDPYKAEIDALKKYTDAYEEAQARREAIDKKYDNADTTAEKVSLIGERIKATEDEIKAIEDLNDARDKEIEKNVELLKVQGFDVSYDPTSDKLQIANLEHLNELKGDTQEDTNKLIKDTEELISKTEDMAKANRDLAVTYQDNIYSIRDLHKELLKLKEDLHDEKITDIEFKIDVAENLGDIDRQIEGLTEKITTTINDLNEAYDMGLDNTSDYVQGLIKDLMDAANKIKDTQKEIYENKRDDYDSAKNAVTRVIDNEIKALQDEKDALQKLNDEQDRAIKLSQLQEALAKAKETKIHVYRKGQG